MARPRSPGSEVLGDREGVFGQVAPVTHCVAGAGLSRRRAPAPTVGLARAAARQQVWDASAAPDLSRELYIDLDATITVAHSEKENAAATWKRTFGLHPQLAFLDRADIAGGEALGGLPRPGNVGANTASDQIQVLDMALASLPE